MMYGITIIGEDFDCIIDCLIL